MIVQHPEAGRRFGCSTTYILKYDDFPKGSRTVIIVTIWYTGSMMIQNAGLHWILQYNINMCMWPYILYVRFCLDLPESFSPPLNLFRPFPRPPRLLSWSPCCENLEGIFPIITLLETDIAPEIGCPKRKFIFQPSIFRGYVSLGRVVETLPLCNSPLTQHDLSLHHIGLIGWSWNFAATTVVRHKPPRWAPYDGYK